MGATHSKDFSCLECTKNHIVDKLGWLIDFVEQESGKACKDKRLLGKSGVIAPLGLLRYRPD